MPKAQFIAVSRATGKAGRAAILLCCTGSGEVAAIAAGGHYHGLDGACLAYLGVLVCEGLLTAPSLLRAAYARTLAWSGSFPAVSAEAAGAAGAVAPSTGPLARVTGELVRLTGTLSDAPGRSVRQDSGLPALLAIATAAISDTQNFDAATEVWKTGSFAVAGGLTGPRPRSYDVTPLGLFGGQSAAGLRLQRLSYQHRQQAGLDALLALSTPLAPSAPEEQRYAAAEWPAREPW